MAGTFKQSDSSDRNIISGVEGKGEDKMRNNGIPPSEHQPDQGYKDEGTSETSKKRETPRVTPHVGLILQNRSDAEDRSDVNMTHEIEVGKPTDHANISEVAQVVSDETKDVIGTVGLSGDECPAIPEVNRNDLKLSELMASVALPQDYEIGGLDTTQVTVPISKVPSDGFALFHPDPTKRIVCNVLRDKGEGDFYVLRKDMVSILQPGDCKPMELAPYLLTDGSCGFCPVGLPEGGRYNSWHKSLRGITITRAGKWVRVIACYAIKGYNIVDMPEESVPHLPDWSGVDVDQLIEQMLVSSLIDSEDHPAIKKLRGLL